MRCQKLNTLLLFAGSALASPKSSKCSNPHTTITSLPASCTTRPTQTLYSTSGCALTCASDFCIRDEAVTIPCGCPRVAIEPTTITICATSTPCFQCFTGWGTFFVTAPCTQTSTGKPGKPTVTRY